MKKLTEIAITRPLLITVVFVALILFGLISYNSLNYELLPKFDANVITVITTYRGASAEEIENSVTKNIEEALSSVEGIDKVTASSQEGTSVVILQLLNGINVDKAQNDAQRKVDQISKILPKNADRSIVNKFSTSDIPVLRTGVTASTDDRALYDVIDQQVKPQIANVEGVGQVNLIGGNERQILINANRDKLQAYGMSISDLAQVVTGASLSNPAGKVEEGSNQFSIKFDAKFNNVENLRNMVVKYSSDGGRIYLRDIADVVDGQQEATAINRINGLPSIGLQVMKQSDANAVEVSKLVRARMTKLEKDYSNIKLHFEVASDQSIYTLSSAHAVMEDLILAVIIVSFVMLMFLHSIRSSLFVLVALPASMIPTFVFMYLFGMTLNLMTLMALSLVVGILVDDSIVILENIMRHMEMGKNKRQATIDGRAEIGFTALAITMVDVVVFLPMALAGGLIGNIIREFSLVVVCSTLMSLMVCFTLTPLLAARFGRLVHLDKKTLWGRFSLGFEKQINNLRDAYTNILQWCLRHKRWVFITTIALLIGSFMLMAKGFIGFSFFSKSDQGEILVKLEMAPQTSLYETNMIAQKAEKIVLSHKDIVLNAFTNVGYSSTAQLTSSNSNVAEINVKMIDKEQRPGMSADDFGNMLKDSISKIPGVKVTVGIIGITGGADAAPVQVVVKGPKREEVRKIADQFKKIMEGTAGTVYIQFSTKDPKPEINVHLDREKMAIFGLDASSVGTALNNAFSGNDQAKFNYSGNEYDILVQNEKFDRKNIDNVRDLTFINKNGLPIQLRQFANVSEEIGESVLERMNRLPSITINSDVQGRSTGVVGAELKKKFDAVKLPNGITWQYIGQLENQSDAFSSMLLALLIGIVLMYLIMVALYENAIYPFVVLFALPLAMIGAFLALALTGSEMTIFAMIGLIMLMGLVAKNGILLVDFTNQRKAEGAGLVEALIDAGRERFRPILMTTIAMIVGMMPIALASGSGAEFKNGMAWVIIGGLASSLLLTLVVVPCVYYVIDKLLNRSKGKKRRKLVRQVKERQALDAQIS